MKKRFKSNLPDIIKGMTLEHAKLTCLSEGYVLGLVNNNPIHETYLVTVTDIDSDGKILNAKYGK